MAEFRINLSDLNFTIDDISKAYQQGIEDCFISMHDFSDLDQTLNIAKIKSIDEQGDEEI